MISDASTSSDGEVLLATLEDDPDTSGTQYTLLTVPAGTSRFVTDGVKPKDVIRYLFTTDGFGGTVYTEFVIDAGDQRDHPATRVAWPHGRDQRAAEGRSLA